MTTTTTTVNERRQGPSSISDLMDELNSPMQLKPQDLAKFTASDLYFIGTYHKGLTRTPEEIVRWIEERGGISASEQAFALEYRKDKMQGKVMVMGRIEETAYASHQNVEYTPAQIIVSGDSGEQLIVQNQPLPLPQVPAREGLQAMIVILGAIFDLKNGQLTVIGDTKRWTEWFGNEKSPVKPTSFPVIAKLVVGILESHSRWADVKKKNTTMKGAVFFQFLGEALSVCPWPDYLNAHHIVCTSLLRAVQVAVDPKTGRKKITGKIKNPYSATQKLYFDNLSVKKIGKSKVPEINDAVEAHIRRFGACYIWQGAGPTRIFFPKSADPNAESAYVVHQGVTAWAGGPSRGVTSMFASYGYCGMLSEMHRGVVDYLRIVMMVEGDIDIRCSIVQSAIIQRSLPKEVMDRFRFIFDRSQMTKLHTNVRAKTSHVERASSTLVWVTDASPQGRKDGKTVNDALDDQAMSFISSLPEKFVLVTPVYSSVFFEYGKVGHIKPYSYDFGALFVSKKVSLTSLYYEPQRPELVKFEDKSSHWFGHVIMSCRVMCTFFLSPKSSYHPVLNMMRAPPANYVLAYDEETGWTSIELAQVSVLEDTQDDLYHGEEESDELPVDDIYYEQVDEVYQERPKKRTETSSAPDKKKERKGKEKEKDMRLEDDGDPSFVGIEQVGVDGMALADDEEGAEM